MSASKKDGTKKIREWAHSQSAKSAGTLQEKETMSSWDVASSNKSRLDWSGEKHLDALLYIHRDTGLELQVNVILVLCSPKHVCECVGVSTFVGARCVLPNH